MAARKKGILARLRFSLWALVLIAGIAATYYYMQKINEPVPGIGGPFTMQATTGKAFTEKDLVGRPSLMFFGYTFCPDVCPTTLADTTSWRAALGLGADDLNIIFVSVDPERDDMNSLKEYVAAFGSPVIGLRGTDAQTDAIKKAYGVFSEKVDDPGASGYLVNHTASVYMLNDKGQFVGTLAYGEAKDVALEKIRRLVSG